MANSVKIGRDRGIDLIKAFATIAVVMIHGKNIYSYANASIDNNYIVKTIGFIMSSGVPLFFFASGYLWGVKTKRNTINVKNESVKICNTLVIPYILVNCICLLFELTVSLFAKSYSEVNSFSFVDIVSYVTWNPIYSPFWFIRNLVVLKMLSVIVEQIHIKATDYFAVLILFLGLFIPVILDDHVNVSLIYYGLGMILGRRYEYVNALINRIKRKELFYATAIVLLCLLLNLIIQNPFLIRVQMILLVLAEIVLIWAYGRRANAVFVMDTIGANSFFIYAFHGKILSAIQILTTKIFVTNSVVLFMEYLGLPLIVISILIISSELLKKKGPVMYRLITGGR